MSSIPLFLYDVGYCDSSENVSHSTVRLKRVGDMEGTRLFSDDGAPPSERYGILRSGDLYISLYIKNII